MPTENDLILFLGTYNTCSQPAVPELVQIITSIYKESKIQFTMSLPRYKIIHIQILLVYYNGK